MMRQLRDSEYEVSPSTARETKGRLQAANRSNAIRTFFDPDAVRVLPARGAATPWEATFRLKAIGTPEAMEPIGPLVEAPRAEGQRVEYRRDGVSEWWVNRPTGLEHGFTIAAPPNRAARRHLQLEIEVAGGFDLESSGDGSSVSLHKNGVELRYAGLTVRDATGRVLPAHMRAGEGRIEIATDVARATWPVIVDPTLTQEAKLIAQSEPDGGDADTFGYAVAVSGNTAVVGSPLDDIGGNDDQGSAYVFLRTGSVWSLQQKLTAGDGGAIDYFGAAVAVAGDTAIVGAYLSDAPNADQGAAYVFVRSAGVWAQQQKLTAPAGVSGAYFGSSVAVSGNTALVGARLDDDGQNLDEGSAYVFVRSGSVWSFQQKLTAADGASGDQLGTAVALDGDTALLGAPFGQVSGAAFRGAAYVFVRVANTWSLQQKLVASDGASGDNFGFAVAAAGESVVVGAPEDNSGRGSAYVFLRQAGVWSQQQKLTAADGVAFDALGVSVAISGDTALVGAGHDDVSSNVDQGSAYVFVRNAGVWTQQQKLTAADGAASDSFGRAVALSADTALVGALNDDLVAPDQGSSYVWFRSAGVWTQQQKLAATDGAALDSVGTAVAVSADTALVGAPEDSAGSEVARGAAYVFVGNAGVWSQQQKLTPSSGAAGDAFGRSVAISGNTAVVGAAGYDSGPNLDQGAAFVFVRNGATWTQQQMLVAPDAAADAFFGSAVAVSGDTAVVGACFDDVGPAVDQGSAYVFVRSGSVWSLQQKLTASDGAGDDRLGCAAAIAGDTAILGAHEAGVGPNLGQGSAYVFVRSGNTWSEQQKLAASDGAAQDHFGTSVALSAETALIGAPDADVASNPDRGAAYAFVRSAGAWTQQQKLIASDGGPGDAFGSSLALAADTGVVGAPRDTVAANPDQGSAYVFSRIAGVWSQDQKLTASDGLALDRFGASIGSSGATAVIGAPDDVVVDNVAQGSAYVFRAAALTADLSVTKTDSQTTVVAGSLLSYTIVAANAGPSALTGVVVADTFPAAITGVTWTCAASTGSSCGAASGAGNIGQVVDLAVGGSVTYTAAATLSASAAGTLANTATVASSVTDPVPGNNSATDTDTIIPLADLAVTKSDGRTTVTPGTPVTYTIVASNAGPNPAVGATVVDSVPAALTAVTWTCVGAGGGTCAPSGAGNINHIVNLPVGASVTYTLNGTVAANPTALVNTVVVVPPSGLVDPNLANNSATDEDLLQCAAERVVVADGRVNASTLGAGATQWFVSQLKNGSSYSAEFGNTTGDATPPGTLTVFAGSDGCGGTSSLVVRDTSAVEPAGAGLRRVSFVAQGGGSFFRARLVSVSAATVPYSFSWSETTLYSAAWSTNGSFDTFYSFQNTTSASITGTLTLFDTTGALIASVPVTVPAGQTTSLNTQGASVTRNRTGTARFTHDGPPGSVIAEAAVANFTISPAYVQPVKFVSVREAR